MFQILQCNPLCAWHTAEHTVGAPCMQECVNKCISHVLITGSLRWKGVRKVTRFLSSLPWPHMTQGCCTAKCGKEFSLLPPSPSTSCLEPALDIVSKRISIIMSDEKVIPTLERVCDVFCSARSKTTLSVNLSTDSVWVWKKLHTKRVAWFYRWKMWIFDIFLLWLVSITIMCIHNTYCKVVNKYVCDCRDLTINHCRYLEFVQHGSENQWETSASFMLSVEGCDSRSLGSHTSLKMCFIWPWFMCHPVCEDRLDLQPFSAKKGEETWRM